VGIRSSPLRRNPDFVRLWIGQTISAFGTRLDALGYTAILTLHVTPLQLGVMNGVVSAPVLVFGFFAGVVVDRLRRRPLMIAADLGRAALLFSIPLVFLAHALTLAQLIIVGTAAGLLTVFFDAAYGALIPVVVPRERLLEANSKIGLSASLAEVTGPGVAGVLVQVFTAPLAVLIDALTFVASAISLGSMRTIERVMERPPARARGTMREIGEGLRAVLGDRVLRALALYGATDAFFGGFFGTLYGLYLIRVLGVGAGGVGLSVAAGGAGDLLGTVLAPTIARRLGLGRATVAVAATAAAFSALYPLAGGPAVLALGVVLIAQFCGDIGHAAFGVYERSLRQARTADHLLGRVHASTAVIVQSLYPAGLLAGGLLAETIGIRSTLWLAVGGFTLSIGWLVASPLRHADTAGINHDALPTSPP